jgi:hypothetical protein
MRTKKTNLLQIVVIITALSYIIIGASFFITPYYFGKVFTMQINEDWLNQIRLDAFLVMINMIARVLSFLLVVVGISMIMPIFDPLKYRLMIYMYGVIFPFAAMVFYLYNGIVDGIISARLFGSFYAVVFAFHTIALFLTKEDAKKGIE